MKYVFGIKIRTYEFPCTTTKLPVAGAFPLQSCSPPLHSEVTTILNSLFYSPSFSLWFCLKYLYPYTICCLVLHVFELYVNGIVEEEYACAPCSFHSPSSWDSTMSFVVLQDFTALYEYNTFYFSAVDGHFNLFQIFLLLHAVLPSVSPGMCVRGIL